MSYTLFDWIREHGKIQVQVVGQAYWMPIAVVMDDPLPSEWHRRANPEGTISAAVHNLRAIEALPDVKKVTTDQ